MIYGKPAVAIDLTTEARRELEGFAGRRRTGQRLARRARIVSLAAEGLDNQRICAELNVDANNQQQIIKTSESGH
jgi:DNA-binding NarL/FixJ family response regulator